MQAPSGEMADGPWRVGAAVDVLVVPGGPIGDAWAAVGDWLAALDAADQPIVRARIVGGDGRPLPERAGSARGFAIDAVADLGTALRAAGGSRDCLIVDLAVDFDPADIAELRRVAASDPMIAGVSPRVDRDALCAFPGAGSGGVEAIREVLRRVFPPVTYAPLPDPRCLYLKGSILAQFPPDLEAGPVDWDGYAAAVNRYGFRMAIANHAIARVRPGGTSGRDGDIGQRLGRLDRMAPGMRDVLAAFLTDTARDAERLLAGLVANSEGRRDIAFDLSHVGPNHSGTAQLARAVIGGAAESWKAEWNVFVVAHAATYDAHIAALPDPPARVDPADPRTFAALVRIGQPFSWKDVDHAVRRAPALVFFMLDTIGLDCLRQAPDDLEALWRFTLAEADGLLFNSAFTQRQFHRRFGVRTDVAQCASLHSLRADEYRLDASDRIGGESVLIVGNGLPHKYMPETARMLARAYPEQSIVALGLEAGTVPGVACHPSGGLDARAMSGLYADARLVVYPTLYEGFGFPLLEALAHRRPVLVRALPPFTEILRKLAQGANIHRFETDAELVRLVGSKIVWTDDAAVLMPARGWAEAVDDVQQVVEAALRDVRHDRVLRRLDFMRGRMDWARRKRFRRAELAGEAGKAFGRDLDRAAGAAGRIAQEIIHALGRLPGSRQALDFLFRVLRRRGRP